jgi:aldehyde dehydrogenase (NAD+)
MENCLLKEVSEFISQKNIGMFIGGKWRDSVEDSTFQTLDPGSGKVLANVAEGKAEDIDAAVKAAKKAFKESNWASMSARERGQYIHRLADLVDQNRQVLVQLESLDVGKALAQADGFDIPNVAQTLRWYADLAVATELKKPLQVQDCRAYQLYTPLGVSAFVLPWNFPLLLRCTSVNL